MDIPPLFRQRANKSTDLIRVADIKLHRQDLNPIPTNILLDLLRDLTQGVDTTSSEDDAEVACWTGCAGELEGGGTTDAGGGTGDEDGFAGEAGGGGGG